MADLAGVSSFLELPGVGSCWLARPRPLQSARGTLRNMLSQNLMSDPVLSNSNIRNKLEVLVQHRMRTTFMRKTRC